MKQYKSYSHWELSMTDDSVFTDDPNLSLFEQSSHKNGGTFWLAAELMKFLGYENAHQLRPAITRAQIVCGNLEIPAEEHFISVTLDDGSKDTKLTRFACYLVAMNADVRRPQVAKAQAYFVAIAESVRMFHEEVENVQRVQLRGDITIRERSLSNAAQEADIVNFGYFQNAGYRGMYNMNLSQLKELRNIPPNRSALDFMGKPELAANLFRITQTEERIRNQQVSGQRGLENAAEFVGREVRQTMIKTGGVRPEELKPSDDIRIVKKEIKNKKKKFDQIDRPKPKSK